MMILAVRKLFPTTFALFSLLVLAPHLHHTAYAQGRPQTVWMRGGFSAAGGSPKYSPDGRFVVIDDNAVLDIYRVSDAMLLHEIVKTNQSAPWGFLPDGRMVLNDSDVYVPGSDDFNLIKIYDANSFLLTDTFPAPAAQTAHVTSFDISLDGQYLIVNANILRLSDRTVISLPDYSGVTYKGSYAFAFGYVISVWDNGNFPWLASLSGSRFWQYSQNGNSLSGVPRYHPTLDLFSVTNGAGTNVYTSGQVQNHQMNCRKVYDSAGDVDAHWSPDGTRIALSGRTYEAVRDAVSGTPIWQRTVPTGASVLHFSPDSATLIAEPLSGMENYVRTLNPDDGSERMRFSWLNGQASVKFSPDGSRLAAWSFTGAGFLDTGLQIWNASNGALIRTLHAGNFVSAAAFVDNNLLLVGHSHQNGVSTDLQAYDLNTGMIVWSRTIGGRGTESLSVSPDGTCYVGIARADLSRYTQRINPRTGVVLATLNFESRGVVSPDGTKIAVPGYSALNVYDQQGVHLQNFQAANFFGADAISWSPDSRKIAVAGNYILALMDIQTGTAQVIQNTARVPAVAWSADGKTLVAAYDAPARLVIYDAATGAELRYYKEDIGWQKPSNFTITSLQFAPDNQTFAFGFGDGTVGTARNPYAVPAATTGGTLNLSGLSSSSPAVSVTLTFAPNDQSGDIVRIVWVDASGVFQVQGLPRTSYTLTARAEHYLTRRIALDLTGGDVSSLMLTLLTGDANGDNVCDISDLLILIAHYNQSAADPNYLEACDFNRDGADDIGDLLLLIAAYNHIGD